MPHNQFGRAGEVSGDIFTRAEFEVKDTDGYIKLRLMDKHGKYANTNAYFIEDLMK